jgi:hypothetical protein
MAVTPQPGTNTSVPVGGAPVQALPGGINGGIITNPVTPADQGIVTAEPLYIDAVGTPGSTDGSGNGTTFVLYPGQTWEAIPGQTTPTLVNAASSGHKFTAIFW